jgi:hypothetical protein
MDCELVTSAVVVWKASYFAASLGKTGQLYRISGSVGRAIRIRTSLLDQEAMGCYFLISSGALPAGWRSVNVAEGDIIFGRGPTPGNYPLDRVLLTPCVSRTMRWRELKAG